MNCYFVYDPEYTEDGAKMIKALSEEEAKDKAATEWGYDPNERKAREDFLRTCVVVFSSVQW